MNDRTMDTLDRRDILRLGAAALGALAGGRMLASIPGTPADGEASMIEYRDKPLEQVRIGFVGVGGQGTSHLENFLKIEGVEVVAICDIVPDRVARGQEMVVKAGGRRPEGYSKGPKDFERMCARNDLDLVVNSTPWEWHVPVCVAAMEAGKHAATEVPAAMTVEDCWRLVTTSEKTRRHCVMLENCNYDRFEMMTLSMVKQGILGELLHATCGYLHDLREVKHDLDGEGVWRRAHSMTRNGDLYPTHGLGPVAQCFDINRGNRLVRLVSSGTKTRGLHLYAVERFGPDSPQAKETYALSDVVTTLLETANGETIVVTHDTNSPRPYSRDYAVQGTKGLVQKYPQPRVYVEGKSQPHRWDELDPWLKQYDHPIWKALEEKSKGAGHGGMDYIEDYRLIEALRKGRPVDMDVYDAAMMSAVTELSAKSIAAHGEPQPFPDFTRGAWKTPRALHVMDMP